MKQFPIKRWRPAIPAVMLSAWMALVGGCGDQVVIEGVDVSDGSVVGDAVLDDPLAPAGAAAGEQYAPGDPYEEGIDGDKDLGPNAPGYLPETID
jgi:hypothetical protein